VRHAAPVEPHDRCPDRYANVGRAKGTVARGRNAGSIVNYVDEGHWLIRSAGSLIVADRCGVAVLRGLDRGVQMIIRVAANAEKRGSICRTQHQHN